MRSTLLASPVGLVEDLRCRSGHGRPSAEDYSPAFQVCLPYRGLFVWHVGPDDVVGDANQVLFVARGEAFRVSEPSPGGYAELIVTPDPELLGRIAGSDDVASHGLFRRRSRLVDHRVQHLRAALLHRARRAVDDPLAIEELALALIRSALSDTSTPSMPGASTRRLIRRTKEFLGAHLASRLRLTDVAREAGASPAYLTDVFRRVEGVSLHQYVLQLRLSCALVELPEADDLTRLALDLGFSSHSHFSSAFRRAFGCTPSAERARYSRRTAST